MPRIPVTAAEIAASMEVRAPSERFEWAARILDRLDEITSGNPARFSAEACDALLDALRSSEKALSAWLEARSPTAATLYLRARRGGSEGRTAEAAARWEEFFRALPCRDPLVLLHSARLLADAHRYTDAAARLRDALALRPDYSFYARADSLVTQLWREVPPTLRQARIAVLGSSTTDLVVQVLRALCFRDGVRADFYQAPYGAYRQEILDRTSGLYRFGPTIAVIMTHWRDLQLPPVVEDEATIVDNVVGEYRLLWQVLAEATGCHIVQHGFDQPACESHGYVAMRNGGRTRVTTLINLELIQQAPTYASVLDTTAVQSEVGRDRWDNPVLWCTAKQHPSTDAIPALAEAQMAHVRAVTGLTRKVLVCDLDDTLWSGVIGEDGLTGIRIGPGSPAGEAHTALQEYLLELKRRGVLLAVCSKNNPEDARLPFEQHRDMRLRLDDFAMFVANWNNKVENLRAIATALSLGTDSFVFLDDNPVERAWVRSQLPDVAVPELGAKPFSYVRDLDRGQYFHSLTLSAEDLERAEQYRREAEREAVRGAFSSLEEFLEHLQMRATEVPITATNIERVTQLVNKTNQFNLTTRRYTDAQIRQAAAAGWARAFQLSDRFGDHGLVSVLLCRAIEPATWEIDTWLMSCRVLGRKLEHFMFDRLRDAAQGSDVRRIVGVYRPTPKNALVADLFDRLGFRLVQGRPDERRYELSLDTGAVERSVDFIALATP